jgi:hypothetical protein
VRLNRPNSGLAGPLALRIDGHEHAAKGFFNSLKRYANSRLSRSEGAPISDCAERVSEKPLSEGQ